MLTYSFLFFFESSAPRRFLQFGSPHALSAIATEVAAAREEVWVSIGYRLSVFGFLAAQVEVDGRPSFILLFYSPSICACTQTKQYPCSGTMALKTSGAPYNGSMPTSHHLEGIQTTSQ